MSLEQIYAMLEEAREHVTCVDLAWRIDEALRQGPPKIVVPKGWQAVPIEPTLKMLRCPPRNTPGYYTQHLTAATNRQMMWNDMLELAPKEP